MASFTHVIVDAEGWAYSNAIHTGHFPRLLWQMLRAFDYTEPHSTQDMILACWAPSAVR